jgi:hypothetical protein
MSPRASWRASHCHTTWKRQLFARETRQLMTNVLAADRDRTRAAPRSEDNDTFCELGVMQGARRTAMNFAERLPRLSQSRASKRKGNEPRGPRRSGPFLIAACCVSFNLL